MSRYSNFNLVFQILQNVNLKTVGRTDIFTTLYDNTYISEVFVSNTTVDNITDLATLRIGKTPNYNEFVSATKLSADLLNVGNYQILRNNGVMTKFNRDDVICFDVTIGSTATTHLVTIGVFGFMFPEIVE